MIQSPREKPAGKSLQTVPERLLPQAAGLPGNPQPVSIIKASRRNGKLLFLLWGTKKPYGKKCINQAQNTTGAVPVEGNGAGYFPISVLQLKLANYPKIKANMENSGIATIKTARAATSVTLIRMPPLGTASLE